MTRLYVHLIVINFFVFYMSELIRHPDCRVLRIITVNILKLTSSYQRLYLLENGLMTFYCISSFSIFVVGLFINGKNKKKKLSSCVYKRWLVTIFVLGRNIH